MVTFALYAQQDLVIEGGHKEQHWLHLYDYVDESFMSMKILAQEHNSRLAGRARVYVEAMAYEVGLPIETAPITLRAMHRTQILRWHASAKIPITIWNQQEGVCTIIPKGTSLGMIHCECRYAEDIGDIHDIIKDDDDDDMEQWYSF